MFKEIFGSASDQNHEGSWSDLGENKPKKIEDVLTKEEIQILKEDMGVSNTNNDEEEEFLDLSELKDSPTPLYQYIDFSN